MLTLPVYDLVEKIFLQDFFVEYRNTILEKLFPNINFAVGTVASASDWEQGKIAQTLDEGFEEYNLVGATSSRKHGHFLFAQAPKTLFVDWFGSNMNAVNYGSNLTTECQTILKIRPTLLVVEDGVHRTGDCHGKVSPAWAKHFAFANNSCQFRLVSSNPKWVAKGTLVSSGNLPEGIDMVLPTSCFKGNKVKPGVYSQELWLGIKDIFKVGEVSLSFSMVQFLSWGTVSQDLLPQTIKSAQNLSQIYSDPEIQKSFMQSNLKDDCASKVVELDKYDQLLNHPYIQSKLDKALAKEWRKIATGTAVRFNLSTCVPDERLADHECCIPGLLDGEEVIVFPYPCRWKYDIKVWTNRVLFSWHQEDVIITNHKTALELGRDFDGDRLPWALASDYPNIATEVKGFGVAPLSDLKPKKQSLDLSLGQIAAMHLDSAIGLITWVIAKANCLGREDIISALVPQLQLAVDCLKGAEHPNKVVINHCLKSLNKSIPWMDQYKDPSRYTKLPIDSGDLNDTISCLNREVAKYWLPRSRRITRKTAYRGLYLNIPNSTISLAKRLVSDFSKEYNAILASYPEKASENQERQKDQAISALFNQYKTDCDAMNFPDRFELFKAVWETQHSTNEGTASLCMFLFSDIIAVEFSDLRLKRFKVTKKYNCQFSSIGEIIQLCQLTRVQDYTILVNQDGSSLGTLILHDNPAISGIFPMKIIDKGNHLDCQVIY